MPGKSASGPSDTKSRPTPLAVSTCQKGGRSFGSSNPKSSANQRAEVSASWAETIMWFSSIDTPPSCRALAEQPTHLGHPARPSVVRRPESGRAASSSGRAGWTLQDLDDVAVGVAGEAHDGVAELGHRLGLPGDRQ